MSLARKAFVALAGIILLCCIMLLLLLRPGFQKVKVVLNMEAQETQESLLKGWHAFYRADWATIETFLDSPEATLRLHLPIQDTYLMKIKIRSNHVGQQIDVFVNETMVGHHVAARTHRAEKFYLTIPAGVTRQGENFITFKQPLVTSTVAFEQIVLKNFLWGDQSTLLLTWRASRQVSVPWYQWLSMLGVWGTWVGITGFIIRRLRRVEQVPAGPIALFDFYAHLPLGVFLGSLLMFSFVSPYRWVVSGSWPPVQLCLIIVGISKVYLLGMVSRRYMLRKSQERTVVVKSRVEADETSIQPLFTAFKAIGAFIVQDTRRRYERVRRRIRWVGRRQPGNRWLLGFLGLWLLSALLLIVAHLPHVSEQLTNIAIVCLIFAVITKGYTLWSGDSR